MDIKQKKKRISSVDVARMAGVSQSTVSRVFNQTKGVTVSEDTVKRIMKAAKKLNYKPSILARSLQQKSTNIIGIVIRHFDSPFHTGSLNCFSRELQKLGYTTLLLNLSSQSHLDDVLPLALEYQVDGIILTSAFLTSGLEEDCKDYSTPVIQYNRYSSNQNVDSVCMDNKKAGRAIAHFLIQMGHERISFIAGEPGSSTSEDRKSGLIEGLEESGVPLFSEIVGGFSYDSGLEAAEKLLSESSGVLPDAVFCISDLVAAGFMDAARYKFNLRIPEDISVIGFDDIPLASWPRYDLTTVSQPIEQMVIETINVLMEAIKYEKEGHTRKLIPGPIVLRSTVIDRTLL